MDAEHYIGHMHGMINELLVYEWTDHSEVDAISMVDEIMITINPVTGMVGRQWIRDEA